MYSLDIVSEEIAMVYAIYRVSDGYIFKMASCPPSAIASMVAEDESYTDLDTSGMTHVIDGVPVRIEPNG